MSYAFMRFIPAWLMIAAACLAEAAEATHGAKPSPTPPRAPTSDAKFAVPAVVLGASRVRGRLHPEKIQHVVQQSTTKLRPCFENGLRRNPNLEGNVVVALTIARNGEVSDVSNSASDLSDPAVVTCVLAVFAALEFPRPQGGVVQVVFPIWFGTKDSTPISGRAMRVSGALSIKVVRDVVRNELGPLLRCYDIGLLKDRELRGRLVLRFQIAADGSVARVLDAGSVLADNEVLECAFAHFRALQFPPMKAGRTDVTYLVWFSPPNDPEG